MMSAPEPLDEVRVMLTARKLLMVLNEHMNEGRPDRGKVLEALNALAGVTASIIAGCNDPAALQFFIDALQQNIADFQDFARAYPSAHA